MIIEIDESTAINTEDVVMVERKAFANPPQGMPPVWTYIYLRNRPEHIAVTNDIFKEIVKACNMRFPIK